MTMVVKKPNKKCSDSLGLTPHLTDGDIKKINKLYEVCLKREYVNF